MKKKNRLLSTLPGWFSSALSLSSVSSSFFAVARQKNGFSSDVDLSLNTFGLDAGPRFSFPPSKTVQANQRGARERVRLLTKQRFLCQAPLFCPVGPPCQAFVKRKQATLPFLMAVSLKPTFGSVDL